MEHELHPARPLKTEFEIEMRSWRDQWVGRIALEDDIDYLRARQWIVEQGEIATNRMTVGVDKQCGQPVAVVTEAQLYRYRDETWSDSKVRRAAASRLINKLFNTRYAEAFRGSYLQMHEFDNYFVELDTSQESGRPPFGLRAEKVYELGQHTNLLLRLPNVGHLSASFLKEFSEPFIFAGVEAKPKMP